MSAHDHPHRDAMGATLPRVPRHTLLSRIGEGGHGVVYLAHGDGPLARSVAVKVLREGLDSRGALRRFEAERLALSMLDHPAVIPITDAGTTDDGRPFFVMPFVQGEPMTKAAETAHLETRARIELFLLVLSGVAHAHARGILHRDLKPGNVLAERTEGGWRVRIIDWGLARALDPTPSAAEALRTELIGGTIGTPEFMSPEQASGGASRGDIRSDIWSLGALLYLLLTGTLPFAREEVRGLSPAALARYLREYAPTIPSRAARSAREALALRGDLDAIVLKALSPDPSARYQSVESFELDLRAHLDGRPIVARPENAWHSMVRVTRKHRAGSLALISVVVALVGATVVSVAAWRSAQNALKSAEISAAFLDDILGGLEPALAEGRDRTLLIEVLQTATARLPEFDRQDPRGAARVRLAIAEAWWDLGFRGDAGKIVGVALEQLTGVAAEQDPTLRALLALALRDCASRDDIACVQALATRILKSGTIARGAEYPTDRESCVALVRLIGESMCAKPNNHGGWDIESAPNSGEFSATERAARSQLYLDTRANMIAHLERVRGAESEEAFDARIADARLRIDGDPFGPALDELLRVVEALRSRPELVATRATAVSFATLALSQRGQRQEMLAFIDRELPELTRLLGDNHPAILNARFNRSFVIYELGRMDDALSEGVDVLRRYRRSLGPNAAMTKWVAQSVFMYFRDAQRPDLAQETLDAYLVACEETGESPTEAEQYRSYVRDITARRASSAASSQ
ncbi:MAG: serine/threonine-protein kinase [Limnohabitans sp.]|nr:serine/threonine-protein kinase [Limnohabitans sp.]